MILLDCNKFNKLPLSLKPLYLNYVSIQLVSKLKYKDLAFSQALNYYSIDEMKEAFNNSYIDTNNYLIIDDNSHYNKIIRLLEYGNKNVKASKFISHIRTAFEENFGEGGNDV